MQNEITVATSGSAATTTADSDIRLALRKRPRVREAIIQSILFLCGAISILTTFGIVYGLTTESFNFFTQELWEDTNKQIVAGLDRCDYLTGCFQKLARGCPSETAFALVKKSWRLSMLDGNVITVVRGLSGTEAVAHKAGSDFFRLQ